MHLTSAVAYTTVAVLLAAMEFGDPSWTLYLHTTRTVGLSGVFNYSLGEPFLSYYNATLPPGVVADGLTVGVPVGVFSPIFVVVLVLCVSVLANLFAMVSVCFRKSERAIWITKVAVPFVFNVTKLVMVVLVFVVCGMRDVSSILLLTGLQIAIAFLYSLSHSNAAATTKSLGYSRLVPSMLDEVLLQRSNNIVRLTLFLALACQYTGLVVVISGSQSYNLAVVGLAVILGVHDLFYFVITAVLVNGFECTSTMLSTDFIPAMSVVLDWLINVPVPLMLYYAVHSVPRT